MTEYNKKYWIKTKDIQTEKHRKWKKDNYERQLIYNRNYKRVWEKKQRETNPKFKLLKNMRNRLWQALKLAQSKADATPTKADSTPTKADSTLALCGCTLEELIEHLERQFTVEMNWDNYGTYWHVDHIIPCVSWDLFSDSEQKMCFHYTNLQPLEASENIIKKDKYVEDDKIDYVKDFCNEESEIH